MGKKRSVLLAGVFAGILSGGGIGMAYGQLQFERAWQRVQTDPRSLQSDPGSYLCTMGDAPIYAGILGALIGAVAGMCVGLGRLKIRCGTF